MADVGLTFAPTSDYSQQKPTQGSPASPVQDAIRILSFRLPTVLGASAVTPMANLGGSSPFGSSIGAAVIQNWLKQLMLGSGGQGGSPYGDIFGSDTGGQAPPPAPPSSPGASVIVNQPRTVPGGQDQAPQPPPNPFPADSGARGGRAY